ncbi:MAG: hypothetical protein U5L11_08265 [Arhodomonas sp.]|nr:hypothetical protein [Arhodomonas sp.]
MPTTAAAPWSPALSGHPSRRPPPLRSGWSGRWPLLALVLDALAQSFEGGTAWRLLSLVLALAATLCLARAWRRDRRRYAFAGLNALVALALASWVHAGFAAVVPDRLPLDGEVGYLAFPLFTLAVYVGGRLRVEAGELLPAEPGEGVDDAPVWRSMYQLANRVALGHWSSSRWP